MVIIILSSERSSLRALNLVFFPPQLQAQLERIAKVNADLRRKANTHKKQSRALLEEKVDLESQLHSKDAEVEHIKKLIKEQEQFEEQREAVKAAIEASRSVEEEEEEPEVCRQDSTS